MGSGLRSSYPNSGEALAARAIREEKNIGALVTEIIEASMKNKA